MDGWWILEGFVDVIFEYSGYRVLFDHNIIVVCILGYLNVDDDLVLKNFVLNL